MKASLDPPMPVRTVVHPAVRRSRAALVLFLLAASLPIAVPVRAQPGAVQLEDDLQIVVLPQRLLGIGSHGGGQREVALELGEKVLWQGVRGSVGMVLTDRRVLALSTASGSWQSERYRRTETVPDPPLLGGRVGILVLRTRFLGFDGGSGNLIESSIGPAEKVLDWGVSQNVAVAVTNRRVIGLSPFRGGFFERSVTPAERYQGLITVANSATVTTSRRLLIFRAPSGTWEERNLDLRDRR